MQVYRHPLDPLGPLGSLAGKTLLRVKTSQNVSISHFGWFLAKKKLGFHPLGIL